MIMETNSTDNTSTTTTDDSQPVTEDDLRSLKYDNADVETTEVADETEEAEIDQDEATNDTDTEDESVQNTDDSTSFVKGFSNIKGETPEEYAKNLEEAYKNSTAEALRLKQLVDTTKVEAPVIEDREPDTTPSTYAELYVKQKLDKEIADSFNQFKTEYSQVSDTEEYKKFTVVVNQLSNVITSTEGRLAEPKELYDKAAVILGWEKQSVPTEKDKLGMAIKQTAASTKTTSGGATISSKKSKVTDAMIAANKLMYPGKTEAEIREELEPYV